MAGIFAKVEGIDDLAKRLKTFGDDAMPYVKDMSDKAGKVVKDKSKTLAPVDTGNLKKHIRQGKYKVKQGRYKYATNITVGKGAAYYIPLELGHSLVYFGQRTGRRVEGRPFLRPAADLSKSQIESIFTSELNKALERLGGK
jgi:HK97 gp10 family phage protein